MGDAHAMDDAAMREQAGAPITEIRDLYDVATYLREEAMLELNNWPISTDEWSRKKRAAALLAMLGVVEAAIDR
ncbi:hypothetical protein [Roseomonas sp. BN140053]|uniref:hypothetical protein n=1 Tax=Roseomonas sp. BN140053 TaxID=3391898 RepID=UPI0039E75D44